MLHSCVPFVPVCQPCKRHIRLSAMYTGMNIMFAVSCGQPGQGFLRHAPQLCPIHPRMPPCDLPTDYGCMHLSAPLYASHSNDCFKGLQSSMDLLYRSSHCVLMRPHCIHACCKQQPPQEHMITWYGNHVGTSRDISHVELSIRIYEDPGLDRRISAVSQ